MLVSRVPPWSKESEESEVSKELIGAYRRNASVFTPTVKEESDTSTIKGKQL